MPEDAAEKPAKATHLIAYAVKEIGEGDDKRRIYTKVGAAFPHKEDAGFNLELDAVPFNRRLVIMPPRDTEEKEA